MKKFVKRKCYILTVSYLSAAVLVFGVLCSNYYQKAETYERYVSANYQHAFGELVTAVSEMDNALEKSLYATSPTMISAVCTEVFGKAMTAQMSLGVLPLSAQELESTAGFISKVGDYAFVLSKNAAKGQGYTQEELENLRSLSDTASILALNMKSLQTDIQEGVLTMYELEQAEKLLDESESQDVPQTLESSMRLIEKEFPEVPSLIYDGPFSAHELEGEAVSLRELEDVTENKARKAASQLSGISEGKLHLTSKSEGNLPCYYFEAEVSGGNVSIEVTQKGGKVIGMLSSRQPADSRINADQAVNTAIRFLESNGYQGMAETYRIKQSNVITINFAYKDKGVLYYPDLVKVSVAADTGAVCGFESHGYIMCHQQRNAAQTAVTADQARIKVPAELQIHSEKLVVIPTAGGSEKLCYEFVCRNGGEHNCIIYVDAQTGEQEKILILLEDETGALTI